MLILTKFYPILTERYLHTYIVHACMQSTCIQLYALIGYYTQIGELIPTKHNFFRNITSCHLNFGSALFNSYCGDDIDLGPRLLLINQPIMLSKPFSDNRRPWAWWLSGNFGALRSGDRRFESHSSRNVWTLGKLVDYCCASAC